MNKHIFYEDLANAGIEWEPVYLKEDDHTYHFFNEEIKVDELLSVSYLKKSVQVPFTKTAFEVVRDAKPNSKYYARDFLEVEKEWEKAATDGKAHGHRVHSIIEYYLKGLRYEESAFATAICSAFTPIKKRLQTYGTIYTEVPVAILLSRKWGEEIISPLNLTVDNKKVDKVKALNELRFKVFNRGYAGTIDILIVDWENKCFYIHDVKTDIAIRDKNKEFAKPMLSPCENLIDCELEVYSIQVFLYAIVVETMTGFKFVPEKSSIIHVPKNEGKVKPYLINQRLLEAKKIIKQHLL